MVIFEIFRSSFSERFRHLNIEFLREKKSRVFIRKNSYEILTIPHHMGMSYMGQGAYSQDFIFFLTCEWKGSNRKQSARWQDVSWLKASAFYVW
jgi:hypothetical protein